MLAAFMLVVAIVNRETTYGLFAAWIVANLRVAALSGGWDQAWLGIPIPAEILSDAREAAIASYCALMVALFTRLFAAEIKEVGQRWLVQVMHLLAIPPLLLVPILPYHQFLPYMWATIGLGTVCFGLALSLIIVRTRSRVAMWYAGSIALTVASGVFEVAAAALGLREYLGAVNSVTGALASSLLASIAIAEQLRQERLSRSQAQRETIAALRRNKKTYDQVPVGLFSMDRAGRITMFNAAFADILGIRDARRELVHWQDVLGNGPPAEVGTHGTFQREMQGVGRFAERWFRVEVAGGEALEGSLQDVTERKQASLRLEFLASHDQLTELWNRQGWEQVVAAHRIARGADICIALLNLVRFKQINDHFGHAAGDELLRQVSSRLRQGVGGEADLARLGADTFAIGLRSIPLGVARLLCEGIAHSLEQTPFAVSDKSFSIRVCIGLVEVPSSLGLHEAVTMADQAYREAKHAHSGSVVVVSADPTSMLARLSDLRLSDSLLDGLPYARMSLRAQPILSVKEPFRALNWEMLLRIQAEDGSMIPVGKFLAAAERNGMMSNVDRWVLKTVLEWIDTHVSRLGRTQFICMNLSGASLNDARFVADACAMLSHHPRAAKAVCLEVTESVALADFRASRTFIERVKALGARVALDDFGAGYTSFAYLKELPADALKLDGSFVRGITSHPANHSIVQAIVELSKNLGMQSIAEWAEDAAMVRSLVEMGADHIQGFAIATPLELSKVLTLESAADCVGDPEITDLLKQVAKRPYPLFSV